MSTLTWNGGTGQIDDAKNWTPRVAPNEADTVKIWGGTVLAPGGSPPDFTIEMGRQNIAVQPTLVLQSGTIEAGVVIETGLSPQATHGPNSGTVANARVEAQGNTLIKGKLDAVTGRDNTAKSALHVRIDHGASLENRGTFLAEKGSSLSVTQVDGSARFLNNGTVKADGGVVTMTGAQGHGTIAAANGGFVEITGAVGSGENAVVSSGMLVLDSAAKFEGGLYNFRGAGVVELKNTHINAASVSTTNGNLGLNLATNHGNETIELFGDAGKGPVVLNVGADSFLFADPTSGSPAANTNVDFALLKAHTPYGALSSDGFAHAVGYVPTPHLA